MDNKKCLNHAYCFLCCLKLKVNGCTWHESQQVQLVGLFFPMRFWLGCVRKRCTHVCTVASRLQPLKQEGSPMNCFLATVLSWVVVTLLCFLGTVLALMYDCAAIL